MEKFLSTEQAAEFLQISRNYLYKLTSAKRLPFYQPTGRKVLFAESDLVAFVRKGKVSSLDEQEAEAATMIALGKKK